MTCEELGGSCDETIEGNNAHEMAQSMYEHVKAEHPDDLAYLTGTSMAMDRLRATAGKAFQEEEGA